VGGLPHPLFLPEHLQPLLSESYNILLCAPSHGEKRRKSSSSSSSSSSPCISASSVLAARRVLQRGICQRLAYLLEERELLRNTRGTDTRSNQSIKGNSGVHTPPPPLPLHSPLGSPPSHPVQNHEEEEEQEASRKEKDSLSSHASSHLAIVPLNRPLFHAKQQAKEPSEKDQDMQPNRRMRRRQGGQHTTPTGSAKGGFVSLIGRGERTSCPLLELPKSSYRGFREAFISFWSKLAFTCQRKGLLEEEEEEEEKEKEEEDDMLPKKKKGEEEETGHGTQREKKGDEKNKKRRVRGGGEGGGGGGNLFGLFDLLSGFAGSGARRIRFAGSLAVLGVCQGLTASLTALGREEERLHACLHLHLQRTRSKDRQEKDLKDSSLNPSRDTPHRKGSSSSSLLPAAKRGTKRGKGGEEEEERDNEEREEEDSLRKSSDIEKQTRMQLGKIKIRMRRTTEVIEIFTKECLALRVRDVCLLIRSEIFYGV
ncbi:hypothetical protein CSUI_010810, partial [Cystoisospora suis]